MTPTFQKKNPPKKKLKSKKKIFLKKSKKSVSYQKKGGRGPAAPRARPFFGMTPTQDIRDLCEHTISHPRLDVLFHIVSHRLSFCSKSQHVSYEWCHAKKSISG